MNGKQLFELGLNQFTKRESLMSLWQEFAENFYPERADFTLNRVAGTDFGAGMMTSYPFLCRRDLGDQFGQMLRPTASRWAHMKPRGIKLDIDHDAKEWIEWMEGVQHEAMYDPVTQFTRAMNLADHDFATFGQDVYTVEMNYRKSALLYRTYHIRDVTWIENDEGETGAVWRKWKPQVRDLARLYPNTIHQSVQELSRRQPFEEVSCVHMVVDAEMYTGDIIDPRPVGRGVMRGEQPRILLTYDTQHDKVLEAVPIWNKHYVVERWQKPGHTQFAFSPAAVAGLADARLLQAMTLTLLEAGEKITNPPMIATLEAVRSDVDIAPGGITWVDIEYDERLGQALRPMTLDAKGMPIGIDMQRDSRAMIQQAFYLNKIAPPLISKDPRMTAFQAGQVVQQWIRDALPLFEPMELERNGQLCEESFQVLWRNGAFGDARRLPKKLQGRPFDWAFTSPLHDVIEQTKGQKFLEMKQLLSEAVAMDPSTAYIPDTITAFREALSGIGVPQKWQRSESDVEVLIRRAKEQEAGQALLERMKTASEATKNVASAGLSNAQAAVAA